ncbi:MAG TPA: guanylate kinase [Parachlamydiaceae bacterium]|nr:guanylate kinase [Parachlamydiaceae bacterium]
MLNKKGKVFVVSAPAGTGKTTLVKKLLEEFPHVKATVSCTTRPPRKGEVEGVDYFFIERQAFEQKIKDGQFLEHVKLYGDYYGTSKDSIQKLQERGLDVVLVIDTEGALNIKKMMDATLIFIMPPSLDELAARLENRKTEKTEERMKRLEWAKHEMEDAKYYDYMIVNDDLKAAYEVLRSIFIAEDHRMNKI